MSDPLWIGCVGDINDLPVTVSTSRGRVRIAVGSRIAILGQEEAEAFAQLLVRACREAARQVRDG